MVVVQEGLTAFSNQIESVKTGLVLLFEAAVLTRDVTWSFVVLNQRGVICARSKGSFHVSQSPSIYILLAHLNITYQPHITCFLVRVPSRRALHISMHVFDRNLLMLLTTIDIYEACAKAGLVSLTPNVVHVSSNNYYYTYSLVGNTVGWKVPYFACKLLIIVQNCFI